MALFFILKKQYRQYSHQNTSYNQILMNLSSFSSKPFQSEQQPLIFLLSNINTNHNSQHTKYSHKNKQKQFDIQLFKTPSQMSKINQISCGSNFTMLLDQNNRLFSFGNNIYGQLGYQRQNQTNQIKEIKINKKFTIKGIRCGFTHTVIFGDKDCYGWGDHQFGTLGFEPQQIVNPWMPRKLPIFVTANQRIIDINCGNNTTIFNISNMFYCLGDNHQGQLGIFPKKPIYNPQKIQIQKNSTIKKVPKLISVKSGDKFTIGIDQNNQLYGAGQVSKLGLYLNTKSALSLGLIQLEYKYQNKMNKLTNVEYYGCNVNLVVKYFNNNDYLHVFGSQIRTVQLKNKEKISRDIQIIGFNQNCILGKQQANIYQWGIQKDIISIFESDKMGKIDIQVGCQILEDNIVFIQNSQLNKPYFQSNSTNKTERYQQLTNKISNYQIKTSFQQNKIPSINNSLKLPSSNLTNQYQLQLQKLKKQTTQQKQIIKLFEQYTRKLEHQNEQLKQKLKIVEKQQIQGQDKVTDCLNVLKSMLKKTLNQYNQKNNQEWM